MYCKVCGTETNVKFYTSKRQCLCKACASETPKKIGRAEFDRRYWGKNINEVPLSTRNEFYSDYLCSTYNFEMYVYETTMEI